MNTMTRKLPRKQRIGFNLPLSIVAAAFGVAAMAAAPAIAQEESSQPLQLGRLYRGRHGQEL
ncbi:hypothetical protein ACFQAT_24965 [Undibacterium arcticum]|uniref:hypothetical protein n=1 Tax=Undibacterium arcticum TaxID=1762892 RepID=UPI00361087BE